MTAPSDTGWPQCASRVPRTRAKSRCRLYPRIERFLAHHTAHRNPYRSPRIAPRRPVDAQVRRSVTGGARKCGSAFARPWCGAGVAHSPPSSAHALRDTDTALPCVPLTPVSAGHDCAGAPAFASPTPVAGRAAGAAASTEAAPDTDAAIACPHATRLLAPTGPAGIDTARMASEPLVTLSAMAQRGLGSLAAVPLMTAATTARGGLGHLAAVPLITSSVSAGRGIGSLAAVPLTTVAAAQNPGTQLPSVRDAGQATAADPVTSVEQPMALLRLSSPQPRATQKTSPLLSDTSASGVRTQSGPLIAEAAVQNPQSATHDALSAATDAPVAPRLASAPPIMSLFAKCLCEPVSLSLSPSIATRIARAEADTCRVAVAAPAAFCSPSPDDVVKAHQRSAFHADVRPVEAGVTPVRTGPSADTTKLPPVRLLAQQRPKCRSLGPAASAADPADGGASDDSAPSAAGPAEAGSARTGVVTPMVVSPAATPPRCTTPKPAALSEPSSRRTSRSRATDVVSEYRRAADAGKPMISMAVVGHVDAGKSTVMGHLLLKLGAVSQRDMHAYKRDSQRIGKGSFCYAWVFDQTAQERERCVLARRRAMPTRLAALLR